MLNIKNISYIPYLYNDSGIKLNQTVSVEFSLVAIAQMQPGTKKSFAT